MADLRTNFVGIKSPNPFWLASAPPTDKAYNVVRAFEAGWGGVVGKTVGEDPPAGTVAPRRPPPPTRATASGAPARQGGAASGGRRWAKPRRLSTCPRATRPITARTV